jgi:murein DD-endopeptidase MepM/ murein hydrolase activator NlpD
LKIILLFIPLSFAFNGFGQNDNIILDTLTLNDRQIFLFKNKKWAFVDDYLKNIGYDTLFSRNWETKEIHAYRTERNKSIKSLKVNLRENNSAFIFPLDTFKYLRGFTGYHTGLDLKADLGDTIRAVFDGKIRFAGNIRNGYGNLVIIRHYNGLETYYSHLSKILININDDVKAGDLIGLVGQSGRATTHHLHFEIRYFDKPFDPLKLLSLQERNLISDSLLICGSLFGEVQVDSELDLADANNNDIQYHTIVKDDTLYKLSKKYNTTIEALCQLNTISKSTTLKIGRQLKVKP